MDNLDKLDEPVISTEPGVVPNSDPRQIFTPLVLVGLGLGVGEGLGLGNQVAISTRGVIIWQGVENGHNTGTSPVGEKKNNPWRRFCYPSPQFINRAHEFLNCSLGLKNRAHGLINRTHEFPILALRFCKPYPQIHNLCARFRNLFPRVCKLTDCGPAPTTRFNQATCLAAGYTVLCLLNIIFHSSLK